MDGSQGPIGAKRAPHPTNAMRKVENTKHNVRGCNWRLELKGIRFIGNIVRLPSLSFKSPLLLPLSLGLLFLFSLIQIVNTSEHFVSVYNTVQRYCARHICSNYKRSWSLQSRQQPACAMLNGFSVCNSV